jgi:hypothetical protein
VRADEAPDVALVATDYERCSDDDGVKRGEIEQRVQLVPSHHERAHAGFFEPRSDALRDPGGLAVGGAVDDEYARRGHGSSEFCTSAESYAVGAAPRIGRMAPPV